MKSLNIDPTPIASILELANAIDAHADLIFNEASELKQYKLPHFNPEQIQTLRDAKDDIVLITEFFTANNLNIKLEDGEIMNLIKIINLNKNTEVSKYASCVILVGFLTFIHHIFFRAPIRFAICDALLHLDQSYVEIGLSSFLFAFKIIARHKVETITPEFLNSISFFYLFDFQYPVETVEVLYKLISNIYKVKSINSVQLVHIVCQLPQCTNIPLPSHLVDKFLTLFQSNFLDLQIDYINAFSSLLNKATSFKFQSTFSQLLQSVLNHIESAPFLPLPESKTADQNHSITINDQTIISSSYFIPGFDFFDKPFDRSLLHDKCEITPIPNQIAESLCLLFKSTAFLKQYASNFLNGLAKYINSNKTYILELENIYFQCSISSKEPLLSVDIDQIFKFPLINDPQITIFNSDSNPIFIIRKKMTEFLLICGQPNFFKQFIQNAVKWPLFYAEILSYLIDLKKSLRIYLTTNYNLNFLFDSVNLYTKASQSCKDSDERYVKEIRIGRSYVINFLAEMIDEYNDSVMKKDKITYALLGQLFERNLRDFTLNVLKKYLLKSQNSTATMNAISTVINGSIAQELLDDNNYSQCIDLLVSLFITLNVVFESKTNFDGIESVFKSVSALHLKKMGNSIDFFYAYLDSLFAFRGKFSLQPFIPFISKCTHILFDDEMNDKLYTNLTRFIKDETIKAPEFLHLIMHTFIHSSFFDKFMDLINEILVKKENKIICHDSGFDEYLIDSIHDDEDLHIQRRILNAFKEIGLIHSSSSAVFKFISKLRPNDDGFLPNNEEILLEILRELALDYYFETTNISYSCGKKYETNESHHDNFNNEFTFYFWVFFHEKEKVEDDDTEYSLLEIKDTFSIVLQNNRIYIKNDKNKIQINNIEMNWKWNLISISHSKEEDSKLTIQVNYQMSEQKVDFDKAVFDFSKIVIGDEKLLNNDVEVCNVSLIKKAKINDIVKFYSDGPNKKTGSFSFEKVCNTKSEENEIIKNFIYYLIHSWEIDILMPLFALIDLNFRDQDRHFSSSFYYSMEIFVTAFLSLKNASSDIFLALSCILSTYSANKLTFSVYNRFYELYGFIHDEEIKDALFINILSNAEIWSHNETEIDKIVKHWSKFLVDSFTKNFSFSFALNYFYLYLNFTDNKYNECVKAIRVILLSIAKSHFTKEDFQNLIFECIGEFNESSFLILQKLVIYIPDKLKAMELKLEDVIHLNRIIIYKNQNTICQMIESIIILHRENLIQDISLYEHLNLILQDLPATAIHDEFFSQMMAHLKLGITELIPICAWYCFKEKDIEASKQFVSIFNSFTSLNYKEFLIWPIILALKSELAIKLSIIYHIADIFSDKWKEILVLLDLICTAIPYDPKELQFYFMDYLLQQFEVSKELDELHEFIEYYCFLIFYQKQNNYFYCNEMKELFETVYNEKIENPKIPDLSYVFPQVLNSNITKISYEHLNFTLILRNDRNDNHFTDDSRLKHAYEKIANNGKEDLIKSILYLLRTQHRDFVDEQIAKNNFSTKEIFQTPLFLRTFNQLNYIDIAFEYRKIFKELLRTISESMKYSIFGFANFKIGFHPYENFQSIVLQRRKKNRIIWARLWSSLSITKGPWDSKMVTEYRGPSRWKRDNTLCFAYCPMKMKRNFHFITHGKSIDTKPHPKIALALFADSSTDLLQMNLKEESNEQQTNDTEKENNQQQQQLILSINPYSLSPDFSRDDESKRSTKYIQVVDCKLIKVIGELDAKFFLFKDKIDIQAVNQKEITILNNKIKYILKKTRFHKTTAIEILTSDRLNFFIDFQNEDVWNSVVENLSKRIKNFQPKLSFSSFFQTFKYTQKWKQREISNFEYLMLVNILSGRSFNDLSQYPFLPWVLTDYSSSYLDLSNEKIFRPLHKPIGAIESSNLAKILERYKDFLNDVDETTKPYMFPSGPISPLSICLYLTRMEPFTTLHVQLQGGKFDVPDRLVTSIEQLFNGIVRGNAESWELSPEFFFQVEFLTNDNEFDLGKINNERIDDIELPKWSSSPFDFIYKHRKALESDFVSDHLNEWIDLNFGYLQKSTEFYNLYNDKLYEDVWQHYSFNDIKIRKIVETTLLMVGQIPPKMFKERHPSREKDTFDYQKIQQNAKVQQIESPIVDSIFCVFSHNNDNEECHLISISSSYELTTLSISIDTNNIDDSVKIVSKEQIYEIIDKGRKCQKQNQIIQNINNKNDDETKLNIKKIGNGKLAILNNDSFLVYSFNQSKKYIFEIPFVKCISSSHDWTIFSTRESILNIYQKNKRIASTHQYRDVITCCTVSRTFRMIVTGTKDGGLIVGTFSGINVRVLELGSTPKKVMITPGWGFIVAYTEPLSLNIHSNENENDSEKLKQKINPQNSPEIVVYSLNGTFIRKLKLDEPIDDWIGWKSKAGFDFIAFSQGRKISYSEVYFLEKFHVARVSRDLIGFTYLIGKCTFVFVEKDGVIEKLYFPINDLYVGYNSVNK